MGSGIGLFKGKILLSAVSLILAFLHFSVLAKGEELHRLGKSDAILSFQSEQQDVVVSIKGNRNFFALNKMQYWDVVIAKVNGSPIKDVELSFDGGMPSHGHGMPTMPKVVKEGDTEFLVKGIKFSMPGVWELYFDIKNEDSTVRLTLEVQLHYGKDLKILSARFS